MFLEFTFQDSSLASTANRICQNTVVPGRCPGVRSRPCLTLDLFYLGAPAAKHQEFRACAAVHTHVLFRLICSDVPAHRIRSATQASHWSGRWPAFVHACVGFPLWDTITEALSSLLSRPDRIEAAKLAWSTGPCAAGGDVCVWRLKSQRPVLRLRVAATERLRGAATSAAIQGDRRGYSEAVSPAETPW